MLVTQPSGGNGGGDAQEAPPAQPVAFDGSTFYDAVVVFGDPKPWPTGDQDAHRFVHEAYRHGKPIGVLTRHHRDPDAATSAFTQRLLGALEHHRFPDRV